MAISMQSYYGVLTYNSLMEWLQQLVMFAEMMTGRGGGGGGGRDDEGVAGEGGGG